VTRKGEEATPKVKIKKVKKVGGRDEDQRSFSCGKVGKRRV
jgi:hypothetical protein